MAFFPPFGRRDWGDETTTGGRGAARFSGSPCLLLPCPHGRGGGWLLWLQKGLLSSALFFFMGGEERMWTDGWCVEPALIQCEGVVLLSMSCVGRRREKSKASARGGGLGVVWIRGRRGQQGGGGGGNGAKQEKKSPKPKPKSYKARAERGKRKATLQPSTKNTTAAFRANNKGQERRTTEGGGRRRRNEQ